MGKYRRQLLKTHHFKVENCVILSEFEQNLMKDTSEFGNSVQQRRLRDPHTKKWFPVQRGGKKYYNHPEAMANRGKKWNQVLPGPSKEMATVIEEQTSSV